ncbi:MAG: DUF4382 domain-containing protein [Verrucomicrobia bacterium]|nr:DUF4382 domain-containing protein [Prolixibacteraceae bacterium]
MKKRIIQFTMMVLVSALVGLTACQENSEDIEAGKGKVVVKLTDAPFPIDLVDKALVTIDKIEIRSTASLNANEEIENSAFIVLSEETQTFNLLDLRNGITADLLAMNIDTGSYDMIRMHVVEGKVILKDGTSHTLKVPGGNSSGLKIKIAPELVVEGGVTNEVLLDFDVSKSFVIQGKVNTPIDLKTIIFKPVVRAVSQKMSSSIAGKVVGVTGAPIAEAYVQVINADTVLTSSLTNASGEYAMIGIPVGTYKMVCEKEGFSPVTVEGVKVELKGKIIQKFELLAE